MFCHSILKILVYICVVKDLLKRFCNDQFITYIILIVKSARFLKNTGIILYSYIRGLCCLCLCLGTWRSLTINRRRVHVFCGDVLGNGISLRLSYK